jgi:hypothetical protein
MPPVGLAPGAGTLSTGRPSARAEATSWAYSMFRLISAKVASRSWISCITIRSSRSAECLARSDSGSSPGSPSIALSSLKSSPSETSAGRSIGSTIAAALASFWTCDSIMVWPVSWGMWNTNRKRTPVFRFKEPPA